MKIYVMTDLEGVAGVLNEADWLGPDGRYHEVAKTLLTEEVNAAVRGFLEAGIEEIVVADGHGRSAIHPDLLHADAQLMRGWPTGWPLLLDETYDCVAWVGQHAKAGTEFSHMAHTQWWSYIDYAINGASVGELGQFAMCAAELGIPAIFASGEKALAAEAGALLPNIETVWAKFGTAPGSGDDLDITAYRASKTAAIHFSPARARKLIHEGARRAGERFLADPSSFGLLELTPPFERRARFRAHPEENVPAFEAHDTHPTSVAALMNLPFRRPEQAAARDGS